MRVTRADLDALRTRTAGPVAAGGRATTGQRGTLRRLRRAAVPRERDTQREILAYMNATPGIWVWKAGAGLLPLANGRRVRMGRAGVVDIIGLVRMHVARQGGGWPVMRRCGDRRCLYELHRPVWIAVEVKRAKGAKPPTPAQLDFLARLREAGSPLAMVATSLDEVRPAVEAL